MPRSGNPSRRRISKHDRAPPRHARPPVHSTLERERVESEMPCTAEGVSRGLQSEHLNPFPPPRPAQGPLPLPRKCGQAVAQCVWTHLSSRNRMNPCCPKNARLFTSEFYLPRPIIWMDTRYNKTAYANGFSTLKNVSSIPVKGVEVKVTMGIKIHCGQFNQYRMQLTRLYHGTRQLLRGTLRL